MARMGEPMSDYRLVSENDELKRRVDALERSMAYLQKQNKELYRVLKSKNSFLDFEFYKDVDEYEEERKRKRESSRRMMAAFGNLR